MKNTIESGDNLKVSAFGNFEVRQKKDRKGRNSQTGEAITIVAKKIVTFRPSTVLRNMING
jgi:integration host factor subunit alpha